MGLVIDRKLERLGENWELAIRKIERLINFWKLQRLTITGRSLVCKTYLMSQVTYLLGAISISLDHGELINRMVAEYMKGSDRILAKNRWFLPTELGGYGLVDTFTLNTCMKATWINNWCINPASCDINGIRSGAELDKPVDQWGVGNTEVIDIATNNIMCAWKDFKRAYYLSNGNILKARLFENDGILEGHPNLGLSIFGQRYHNMNEISKAIRVEDILLNGFIRTKREVEVTLREQLSLVEYFRLRNFIANINQLYIRNNPGQGLCLDNFMRQKKRRCKNFRLILTGRKSPLYRSNDPRTLPSVCTLWGNQIRQGDRKLVELHMSLWSCGGISVKLRDFCFRLLQGRLYLNNVLFNINPRENNRYCTFCEIKAKKDLNDRNITEEQPEYEYYLNLQPTENIDHFFWECTYSQTVIQRSFRWLSNGNILRGNEQITKQEFMVGANRNYNNLTFCDIIWKVYIKFFLYKCRSRKKLPVFGSLLNELVVLLRETKNLNWEAYRTLLENV